MHHLYPLAKGDPLCPLGFHPQVRWPTRCKRCFRDYKEHGGKKRDESTTLKKSDTTSSTPSLSTWSNSNEPTRSWFSSSNLAFDKDNKTNSISSKEFSNPSSWESTPDLSSLHDDTQANIPTVNIKLPTRKQKPIDRTVSDSLSLKQDKIPVFNKNDSLAARAKKLQAIKDSSFDKSKRIHIKEIKSISEETTNSTNNDVQFLIQVKKAKTPAKQTSKESLDLDEDNVSLAGTETTDTTLVDQNDSEYRDEIDSLKKDLDAMRTKCERLEKEKSNILLRRLISMDSSTSKTTSTELLKLQQRCNELQTHLDDYKDEKRALSIKVKELEDDLENRPTAQEAQKIADELRSKLLAAETLCEELMDENEDMKKEMRDLEEEMEEMQDNFREDQADEYTSLKKELEQTTKNCRILSFKLRKTERKVEQIESEKNEAEKKLNMSSVQGGVNYLEKIKNLEKELNTANEKTETLQKELEEHKTKTTTKKKAPMLGSIGRFSSDGKVSRESLTRGGSQEDPVQLLRDLQDSMEREADLREQLKFAEEEAQNLRKKASRIEDDNESLVLQLKKMATKARSRKLSPTNNRLSVNSTEKDEGISDDEDLSEIKLQLELSEQEASVLRKKVEELEVENERAKKKNKDLQDKITTKPKKSLFSSDNDKKVLEDELKIIKKSLSEKVKECEKLQSELNVNRRRSSDLQKIKTVDMDQHTVDLKRQLEVIEQEASVLRTRVQNYENENEKLLQENKKLQLTRNTKTTKTDKAIDKYIDQIATLEIQLSEANMRIKELEEKHSNIDSVDSLKLKLIENERDNLANTLTKLKQDSSKAFNDRLVKKPSELTSKSQLKTMVNDLENEISEILVVLNNSETSKRKLEKELQDVKVNGSNRDIETSLKTNLEDLKSKLSTLEKEVKTEKSKLVKEKQKNDDLNTKFQKNKDALNKLTEENEKYKNELDKHESDYERIKEDKNKISEELNKIKMELDSANTVSENYKRIKNELDGKIKELTTMKNELNTKTKELETTSKKLANLEKEHKSIQEKLVNYEKTKKTEIKQLENKIEEEKSKSKLKETEQSELSEKLKNDCKKLNTQIEDLNNNVLCLESTIKSKNLLIQKLEESLQREKSESSTKNKTEAKQIQELKDEITKYKNNVNDIQSELDKSLTNKKNLEDKLKKAESENKTEKSKCDKKLSDLEADLQNEKKKIDILKVNYEKESKNKELELGILRNKIKSLELNSGMGTKKMTEIKREYQDQIDKLESQLSKGKKDYSELTAKYEILEEEHVVTKAKLVTEIETINNQLQSSKRENDVLESELQTIKDSHNSKQDAWMKEKVKLQDKLKDNEKHSRNSNDLERTRLKSLLEEAQSEVEQIKKECDVANDQMDYMRKENDELRKKLDDFDKVSKIQRNISADSSAMGKEIRELKIKLENTERSKKSEVAEYKLRYESQIHVINEELRSLQTQVTRFKRERDTYKHMLEGAQKTIGELKTSPKSGRENYNTQSNFDEAEEARNKIATLEQQISCMEDELSEARLEGSKLKTELVSDRSTYEVKLSELHSRVNELEEEKILSSGRTKIAGLRTRMELAWQKEREEQQRLLQETATLARDLRQTLYEVERERDKEKLEGKRKVDQLKKTTEEEQEETKKKLTELQCDLLELRDAHAKLRTTNEKLRREKERNEREREEMKNIIHGRRRVDQEDDRRISAIIEQVESLMQIAPDLVGNVEETSSPYTPTPPRRIRGPKSRESSPAFDARGSKESSVARDDKQYQLKTTLHRLIEAADELKRFQKLGEEDRERDRLKRMMGMRRATSTEHDNTEVNKRTRSYPKNGATNSLHRKSLSLEQTAGLHEQNIWKGGDTDSMSSMQSLEFASDVEGNKRSKRDVSLDSRLSGGSTQSEAAGQDKKKKKGIMGKLKKFTKSRSIDDQDPGTFSSTEGLSSKPSSNTDLNEDPRGSKRDLKERLAGIFKKSGSSSRSNSLERQIKAKDNTSSTQRPLMRVGSNTNVSSTSNKSDVKKQK